MSEVSKDGAPAPAEPQHTPLSEIVDKPRLADAPAVVDKPVERETAKPAPPPQQKPDEDARFRGLLNETLTEREKRQAAERERDQYRRAWEEHQRRLAADSEKDPAPDQFKDPVGYNAWVDRQIRKQAESIARQQVQPIMAQVSEAQFRLSEMQAKEALGPDRWKRLNDWIKQQQPDFHQWCNSQPDPYWAAYEQYRQRTTFEKLGNDDIDTYLEKEVQRRLAEKAGPIDPPDDDDFDHDPAPQRPAPKSFANSRSADPTRDASTGRFTGPRPLGDLVRENQQRKKR